MEFKYPSEERPDIPQLAMCANVEWQLVPIFRLFGFDFNECWKKHQANRRRVNRSDTSVSSKMDISKKFLR